MNENLKNVQIDIQKKVGQNIKNIRKEKGLSQVDVASRMIGEFDTTNLSRIEAGRINPTLFTLYRISEALEVPLTDFLDLKE